MHGQSYPNHQGNVAKLPQTHGFTGSWISGRQTIITISNSLNASSIYVLYLASSGNFAQTWQCYTEMNSKWWGNVCQTHVYNIIQTNHVFQHHLQNTGLAWSFRPNFEDTHALELSFLVNSDDHGRNYLFSLKWLCPEQGKSEEFDSCDRPSNLTQIGFKLSIFQPVWPWNEMDDPEK